MTVRITRVHESSRFRPALTNVGFFSNLSSHRTQMNSDPHDLSALEEALGHRFGRRALLEQAVTHASYAREMESQNAAGGTPALAPDNEQMEFLGDAVLGFVVSQELFQRFPEYQEGELSKLRAHLVSARHLLRPARDLGIGQRSEE